MAELGNGCGLYRKSLCITIITLVIFLVGFSTSFWYKEDGYYSDSYFRSGLWEFCHCRRACECKAVDSRYISGEITIIIPTKVTIAFTIASLPQWSRPATGQYCEIYVICHGTYNSLSFLDGKSRLVKVKVILPLPSSIPAKVALWDIKAQM